MIDYVLIIPLIASFFTSLFLIPVWIKKAKQIGLVWKDMNKFEEKTAAGSGGTIVILSFLIGVFIYIAYRVFYLQTSEYLIEIFALLTTILLLSGIGFIDDLLGWQRGGLSRRSRIILVLLAAIPLMAINAGRSAVNVPLLGAIDLGIFYVLVLIPIGIAGATTTFNFLAGFNGLEAGQGILLLTAAGVVSYLTGSSWLFVVSMCMIMALLAFLLFNFYPAKVFPGDALTYGVGGLFAGMCILGNFEKIAVFFFIPYILEMLLKSRGKLIKHSFGEPKKDGSLDLKYAKIYGLTHLSIFLMKKLNIKPTEKKVVFSIWVFQIIVIVIGFVIFGRGLF